MTTIQRSSPHRQQTQPRQRTTVDLKNTNSRPTVLLSFESELALKYAGLWLAAASPLKVPVSGLARRALEVYMQHLSSADPAEEFRDVRASCTASPTSAEGQQMAHLRLYATPPGEPLPVFRDMLRSPAVARQMAELTARAEAMAAECLASRPGRKRPGAAA
jgi:hypothetical protein